MQFSGPRILVVDDEPTILFALREYLSTCGFVIECAENLETALAKLAAQSFSLVIADLRLTGSGGNEGLTVLAEIRRAHPGTRAILLTAYRTLDIEREARALSVDAVIAKPIALPELAQIVYSLVMKGSEGPRPV